MKANVTDSFANVTARVYLCKVELVAPKIQSTRTGQSSYSASFQLSCIKLMFNMMKNAKNTLINISLVKENDSLKKVLDHDVNNINR